MSWAEVKKINSDMTVSLDELFKNSFTLYVSDYPITDTFSFSGSSMDTQPKESTPKVKINYNGTCRIKVTCKYVSGTSSNTDFTAAVYRNGLYVAGGQGYINSDPTTNIDIAVSKGDVISVGLKVITAAGVQTSEYYNVCGYIGIGGIGAEQYIE